MRALGIGIDNGGVAALYRIIGRNGDVVFCFCVVFLELISITERVEIPKILAGDFTFFKPGHIAFALVQTFLLRQLFEEFKPGGDV